MAIDMNEMGETSIVARELAWLELALDPDNLKECCHYVLVDELNGKRIMIATDTFRFHIAGKSAVCFPLGYLPRGEDCYEPEGNYGPYKRILRTITGAKITMNRALLEQYLTKCLALLQKNDEKKQVKFTFTPNKAILSVYSQVKGVVTFELPCSNDIRPETLRINCKWLLEAITGSDSTNVVIQQNSAKDGAVLVTMSDNRAAIIAAIEPILIIK